MAEDLFDRTRLTELCCQQLTSNKITQRIELQKLQSGMFTFLQIAMLGLLIKIMKLHVLSNFPLEHIQAWDGGRKPRNPVHSRTGQSPPRSGPWWPGPPTPWHSRPTISQMSRLSAPAEC